MSTVTQAREDVAVSTVAAPRGCGDVGRPIRLPAALADGTPPLVPSAAHADARVAGPQLGAAVAPLLLAPPAGSRGRTASATSRPRRGCPGERLDLAARGRAGVSVSTWLLVLGVAPLLLAPAGREPGPGVARDVPTAPGVPA